MFEKILIDPAALRRHRSAPFADERERYLQHCADFGAAPASYAQRAVGFCCLRRVLARTYPPGWTWAACGRLEKNVSRPARDSQPNGV